MYLYRGNGAGGFSPMTGTRIGTGWGMFAKVFSPGDFTGDHKADVVGVKANGEMYLYRGNGAGGFSPLAGTRIGYGWGVFAKVFSPRDFSGDGRADVVGVKANGEMYLYRGNGAGGFSPMTGTRIGTGWGVFANVFSPGDFTGDHKADIVGVKANGEMYLYRGNAASGFSPLAGTRIGTGWGMYL
jgi:hypothetical protein